MNEKTIQCLPNPSQHVLIYLQEFPSYMMLKSMRKSKNRYFHVHVRAQDRSKWRSVVETAMLTAGRANDDDDDAMHKHGICCHPVSVRLSVRHVRELRQNE